MFNLPTSPSSVGPRLLHVYGRSGTFSSNEYSASIIPEAT